MKRVVIINGPGGSGKDLFVELTTGILSGTPVFNFSSIDPIKSILKTKGWDGVDKSDEWRMKMVELKKQLVAESDLPTRYLIDKINEVSEGLIFVHIREPEEIEKLKSRISEAFTMHVARPQARVPGNEVDEGTRNYTYDMFLENSGDTEDVLKESADNFILDTMGHIALFDRVIAY